MAGFAKVYSSILSSSVWNYSSDIRVVWVTLLVMADSSGFIDASVPGIAHQARVSIDAVEGALSVFESPDPYSKSESFEGRRLERVEGGFQLLNHGKYRRGDPNSSDARRKSKQRDLGPRVTSCDLAGQFGTRRDVASASVSVDPKSKKRKRSVETKLPADWKPTESHRELASKEKLDCDRQAERFRAHAEANDRRQKNWNGAFSQWLLSPYRERDKTAGVHIAAPSAARSGRFNAIEWAAKQLNENASESEYGPGNGND